MCTCCTWLVSVLLASYVIYIFASTKVPSPLKPKRATLIRHSSLLVDDPTLAPALDVSFHPPFNYRRSDSCISSRHFLSTGYSTFGILSRLSEKKDGKKCRAFRCNDWRRLKSLIWLNEVAQFRSPVKADDRYNQLQIFSMPDRFPASAHII